MGVVVVGGVVLLLWLLGLFSPSLSLYDAAELLLVALLLAVGWADVEPATPPAGELLIC